MAYTADSAVPQTEDGAVAGSRPLPSWLVRPIPSHARRFWYCFGGLTLFTAIALAISGAFLALYYEPTPDRAYASVFYLSHYVKYGWLIRSVHGWAARLMVVFLLVHMIRVYVTASYKHPRELNWVVGVLLFVITIAFSVTGDLLPWDQQAYAGSTAAVALIGRVPAIGETLVRILVGGDRLGAQALTRSYSAHIMLLPTLLVGLLFAHFWMVRKQGISGPL